MYWIDVSQDRDRRRALVKPVMNVRVPQNFVNFLTSFEPVSLLGRTVCRGFI